jgi:hypothetical protein
MERSTRKGRKRKNECGLVRDTTVVQEKGKFDASACSKVMHSRPSCKCGFSTWYTTGRKERKVIGSGRFWACSRGKWLDNCCILGEYLYSYLKGCIMTKIWRSCQATCFGTEMPKYLRVNVCSVCCITKCIAG